MRCVHQPVDPVPSPPRRGRPQEDRQDPLPCVAADAVESRSRGLHSSGAVRARPYRRGKRLALRCWFHAVTVLRSDPDVRSRSRTGLAGQRTQPTGGIMSTTADIDRPSQTQPPDPALDARAAASLSELFEARPTLAADLEEAGRAHTHLEQERQREADARDALTRAEQHASGMTARLDLVGHRFAGFAVGALAVAILLVFDAIPLNWAAQAFGLAAAATWLVTGIMLVASAGAMAGIELTRED